MKCLEPDYSAQFRCLAGDCPDTCCKDWEIIIDSETLMRYNAMPGPFGEKVRAALTTDEEGDTMFRLADGHCPLLSREGLCQIQLTCGEEALCTTCRSHPRFWEEYGATRELTLSLSCPAAAKLLLDREAPITFFSYEDNSPVTVCNDLDPERYFAIRRSRQTAIAIAQDRSLSIPERLSLELLLAVRLQKLLDKAAYGRLDALLTRFLAPSSCKRALARAKRLRVRNTSFFPCWMILNNMEHLTAAFPQLLNQLSAQSTIPAFSPEFTVQWEHLTVYFLWRWYLKASVDGHLLSRVESCLFHVLCISALFAAQPDQRLDKLMELSSLYSKEVEHSEDNLRLLLRIFERKTLSWKALLSLLG